MKAATNQAKPFPFLLAGIVIAALFILVFLGTFVFSFVKTKVINKVTETATNKLGDLQKFGGGKFGNYPDSMTVKTKAEGIDLCKKSGVDYCWAAVAASFNDLSVCNQAPDPQTCRDEAKEFQGLQEGGEGGTEDEGGEPDDGGTGDSEDQTLKECKRGVSYQSTAGKLFVIGKETVKIDGTNYEICCWGGSNDVLEDIDKVEAKNCTITDQPDSLVMFSRVEGEYQLIGATLEIDGKMCTVPYEDGKQQEKVCE